MSCLRLPPKRELLVLLGKLIPPAQGALPITLNLIRRTRIARRVHAVQGGGLFTKKMSIIRHELAQHGLVPNGKVSVA